MAAANNFKWGIFGNPGGEDPSPYHNMALTQLMSFSVKKVTHII
jgi:hypothetical protein